MTTADKQKSMQNLPHQILIGKTWHARREPETHTFSYPYRFWGLSLNRLAEGDFPTDSKIFSQKFSLFSAKGKGLHNFNFDDYFNIHNLDPTNADNFEYQAAFGDGKASKKKTRMWGRASYSAKEQQLKAQNWRARVQEELLRLTNSVPTGDILAMVIGRNFGFYFSPVNFYIGFDSDGNASHILAEASNSPSHKQHFYGFKLSGNHSEFSHDKEFHVSSFNPLDQIYTWKVLVDELEGKQDRSSLQSPFDSSVITGSNTKEQASGFKHIKLSIRVSDERGKVFQAGINMQASPMTAANLRQTICENPIMNYSTMARIHWNAFLLFALRKVPHIGYNQKLRDSKQNPHHSNHP